ncbi:hypothetical protein HanIR_Chr05g0225061 [Helianthus annuus]|nr:hypothetical protein HanIR_Chr05g0225061 [Helianthus annuus]
MSDHAKLTTSCPVWSMALCGEREEFHRRGGQVWRRRGRVWLVGSRNVPRNDPNGDENDD